jgi:prolyl oligopeptidase
VADRLYLFTYSPLHNVKQDTCYPATLITTADHDDRVVPSHSFKFAAALQNAQGCDRPVLIRVETGGSHSFRSTEKRILELADRGLLPRRTDGDQSETLIRCHSTRCQVRNREA